MGNQRLRLRGSRRASSQVVLAACLASGAPLGGQNFPWMGYSWAPQATNTTQLTTATSAPSGCPSIQVQQTNDIGSIAIQEPPPGFKVFWARFEEPAHKNSIIRCGWQDFWGLTPTPQGAWTQFVVNNNAQAGVSSGTTSDLQPPLSPIGNTYYNFWVDASGSSSIQFGADIGTLPVSNITATPGAGYSLSYPAIQHQIGSGSASLAIAAAAVGVGISPIENSSFPSSPITGCIYPAFFQGLEFPAGSTITALAGQLMTNYPMTISSGASFSGMLDKLIMTNPIRPGNTTFACTAPTTFGAAEIYLAVDGTLEWDATASADLTIKASTLEIFPGTTWTLLGGTRTALEITGSSANPNAPAGLRNWGTLQDIGPASSEPLTIRVVDSSLTNAPLNQYSGNSDLTLSNSQSQLQLTGSTVTNGPAEAISAVASLSVPTVVATGTSWLHNYPGCSFSITDTLRVGDGALSLNGLAGTWTTTIPHLELQGNSTVTLQSGMSATWDSVQASGSASSGSANELVNQGSCTIQSSIEVDAGAQLTLNHSGSSFGFHAGATATLAAGTSASAPGGQLTLQGNFPTALPHLVLEDWSQAVSAAGADVTVTTLKMGGDSPTVTNNGGIHITTLDLLSPPPSSNVSATLVNQGTLQGINIATAFTVPTGLTLNLVNGSLQTQIECAQDITIDGTLVLRGDFSSDPSTSNPPLPPCTVNNFGLLRVGVSAQPGVISKSSCSIESVSLDGGTLQVVNGDVSIVGTSTSSGDLNLRGGSSSLDVGSLSGNSWALESVTGSPSCNLILKGETTPQPNGTVSGAIGDPLHLIGTLQVDGGNTQVQDSVSAFFVHMLGGVLQIEKALLINVGATLSAGQLSIAGTTTGGSMTLSGGNLTLADATLSVLNLEVGSLQFASASPTPPVASVTALQWSGSGQTLISGVGTVSASTFDSSLAIAGSQLVLGALGAKTGPTVDIQSSIDTGPGTLQLLGGSKLQSPAPAQVPGVLLLQGGSYEGTSAGSSLTILPTGQLVAQGPGTISAGELNVQGQLTVSGAFQLIGNTNLNFAPGSSSTFTVQSRAGSLLRIAGSTSIQTGASLQLNVRDESFRRFSQYPLMLYGNGGSGQFSQVLVNPSSRSGEFALLYSEQGLFLTVPHGVTHEDQGCTCAQRCLLAIVDDLEETSRGGPLRWLSDEVLRQFPLFPDCCLYQQFVGEPYTDLLPMALYAGRMTTHAVQKQLWRAHDVWLQPRPATHAWVDGWGEQWHQSRGSDPLIAGWRAYGLSFDFGVDAQPSSNSLVGIAGSWVRTRGAVETNCSQLETNMAGANLYGSIWARESLYLDLQFGWSHLRSKLTRHIDVPRLRDQLVAEPHGVRRSARAELGVIDRLTRGLGVQLFSAFEGAWVNLSTWAENSSSAAALVGSKAWSKALWLEQGARLFSTSCLGAWNFQPELTLTSVYNFYQDPYALSVSWLHAADLPTSGCRFCPVEGLTPVAWFGALAPGLIAQRGPLQLAARLNVEAAPRWWSWGGNLQLSYGF